MITFEFFFNLDDQIRDRGMNLAANKDDLIVVAFSDGRMLNMGKVCYENTKERFVHLCQEFNDVFS